MPALDLKEAIALAVLLAGMLANFLAVKNAGAETQRLVKALHGRFDTLASEVATVKIEQARHDERIKMISANLSTTQRLRLKARAEAAQMGQPPIIDDNDD